ncbi:hypothetical protein ACL9RF_07305 [Sphingobacterium sp. Mn56C]|uniref:hypothetical protein n=1 Tax=Sphingobacterium sp. Mn56C TaxID=3395261 RepID=UPI003BCE9626
MKKIGWTCCMLLFLLLSGCAINQKAQVEALAKFNYSVESVEQMRIAGRDVASFSSDGGLNLASVPSIALALLSKDLPLQARVNLKIANPTSTLTKINEFKYIVELSGKPLFEGSVNENINLAQGQSMVVPLSFNANIFNVAKEQGFDSFLSDILTRKSTALLALKIKPSIRIGNQNIFYPGYITIDKDLAKSLRKKL